MVVIDLLIFVDLIIFYFATMAGGPLHMDKVMVIALGAIGGAIIGFYVENKLKVQFREQRMSELESEVEAFRRGALGSGVSSKSSDGPSK